MTRKSLSNAIYLECLAFTITALLAASDVEGTDGGTRVARAYNSGNVCYNSKQQKVKCSKKKSLIIGVVVASLFVLFGAVYLYGKWADRRKRSAATEETEPLSDGSGTAPDCEKGLPKASKNKKNENVDDHVQLHKSGGISSSETSSIASGPSTHDRHPPGFT